MSEIVPFIDAAARRAAEERPPAAGNADIAAVENILKALEGMQAQVAALTDLVIEQDKRIERLEKSKPGRIIAAR